MSLKEKLEKMKINILDSVSWINRDYEFEAELEDHQPGSQNVYRLHYIDYHRIGENYGYRENNIGVIDWSFKPFTLPNGMSREDSFKVLSYLTDYIEKNLNLEHCSYKSVAELDNALNFENLGFMRVNLSSDDFSFDGIDLFTVTGRLQLFKKSSHYQKYFEWYMEGITFDEVKEIYQRCGIDFYDIDVKNLSNECPKLLRKL